MITLIHENGQLQRIRHEDGVSGVVTRDRNMANCLFETARNFPDELIVWCREAYADSLNKEACAEIFHHRRVMCSYLVSNSSWIGERIGYIESTPFINVKYDVAYPTWLMSADVGGIHASVLNAVSPSQYQSKSFDFFLNSLAKSLMPAGVFCYSHPNLLKPGTPISGTPSRATLGTLFRFVARHYKKQWVIILFLCCIFYEKKWPVLSLLYALWFRQRTVDASVVDAIAIRSSRKASASASYDVLIPTIGRKTYLLDFLKDLSEQTLLPSRVIIVEQNPEPGSSTELDYLESETWPFEIRHLFTHETGACQARNHGFKEVTGDWVVLGDDDIRVTPDLFEQMLGYARSYGTGVLTASCLKPGEKQTYLFPGQTTIFGSGSSLLRSNLLQNVQFDTRFEFGFAEDVDFGMQLRNLGEDVIYCPKVKITHLKAPSGGFRTAFTLPWQDDEVEPLPSPTVMLYNLKHRTRQQMLGYKLLYFIRFYRKQSVRNPFRYVRIMRRKWNHSTDWASRLLENEP